MPLQAAVTLVSRDDVELPTAQEVTEFQGLTAKWIRAGEGVGIIYWLVYP